MAKEHREQIVAKAGGYVPPIALVDAATVTPDCSKGTSFTWTVGGARTLANPTNLKDGMPITVRIKQDGTGTRTVTFGSKWKLPSGFAISTAANKVDLLNGIYYADLDQILCGILTGIA